MFEIACAHSQTNLEGSPGRPLAPSGDYKRSGNGREGGVFGLDEYLEIEALIGNNPRAPLIRRSAL